MRMRGFLSCLFIFLLTLFGVQQAFASTSSEFRVEIISVFACADGVDNDGDSLIDFPDDPGCTSATDTDETDPGSGGGGGGGLIGGPGRTKPVPITNVIITGQAYPNQPVTLLKDAQIVSTTTATNEGKFTVDVKDLSSGNFVFSLYSQDINDVRSTLVTFPVAIDKNSLTNINGAFIPPTVRTDKEVVEKGKTLSIAGQTAPNAIVEIVIITPTNTVLSLPTTSNAQGIYTYQFDTNPLELGQHFIRVNATHEGRRSTDSTTIAFEVGLQDTLRATDDGCAFFADLNSDCRVNLIDFSIAAFWYEQSIEGEFAQKEGERLNGDQRINLTDFSIMAFYWTG